MPIRHTHVPIGVGANLSVLPCNPFEDHKIEGANILFVLASSAPLGSHPKTASGCREGITQGGRQLKHSSNTVSAFFQGVYRNLPEWKEDISHLPKMTRTDFSLDSTIS